MSHPLPHAGRSSFPGSPPKADPAALVRLADLALALHDQARALLGSPLHNASTSSDPDDDFEDPALPPSITSQSEDLDDMEIGDPYRDPVSPDVPHIRRCYSIPAFMLDHERDLMDASDADDLSDVLHKLYNDLHVTATLMEHVDIEMETDGEFIQMLGMHLRTTLRSLRDVCSLFDDFKPIPACETA